jgi:hypothetical protein
MVGTDPLPLALGSLVLKSQPLRSSPHARSGENSHKEARAQRSPKGHSAAQKGPASSLGLKCPPVGPESHS